MLESIQGEFALALFISFDFLRAFSECTLTALYLIVSNSTTSKGCLPGWNTPHCFTLCTALFKWWLTSSFGCNILCRYHGIPWHILWLPVIILSFLMMVLGVSWFPLPYSAAFTWRYRSGCWRLTMILMYLSPIFYPISMLPDAYPSSYNSVHWLMSLSKRGIAWCWSKNIAWGAGYLHPHLFRHRNIRL